MIIITGAAGFLGSALAWALNEKGRQDLLLVDEHEKDSTCKNLGTLQYLGYMEKQAFLEAVKESSSELSETEAMLHMGACSSTTEMDVDFLKVNNFQYTRYVAEWCLKNDIRFIYASSAATYGDGTQGYSDNHDGIPGLKPLNPYGQSKQMFDQWALENGVLDKIVGLKYFNVYGPNEYHKGDMRSMVMKGFEQITETGKVRLFKSYKPEYKDGEQLRDFLYVKDAVNMTLHFLSPEVPGGIYNVGTGQARSWLDMMHALFKAMELEPNIEFIPMPEIIWDKYQYFTQAEMDKIRSAGYTAEIASLEDGIADYVKYLSAGPKHLGE
jgi:ADP-L-glycero-D-manno-heptose 6-epimerase